jgi:hypothetical protein
LQHAFLVSAAEDGCWSKHQKQCSEHGALVSDGLAWLGFAINQMVNSQGAKKWGMVTVFREIGCYPISTYPLTNLVETSNLMG